MTGRVPRASGSVGPMNFGAGVPTVQVTDLKDGDFLLDVREDDEWQAGHAEGALHIPISEFVARYGELTEAAGAASTQSVDFPAEVLDAGADFGDVLRGDGDVLAIELDGFLVDAIGDAPIELGRDAGDVAKPVVDFAELLEIANQLICVGAADAGMLGAELVPGQAEFLIGAGAADFAEALSARGGALAFDGGEGLLAADPGAGLDVILRIRERFVGGGFHNRFSPGSRRFLKRVG